ncbi:MAG: hypothetical protein DI532_18845 [Azospirillum brasilense]|nr:MAG: hypothetical protein DI532_18845 [Azospirillum brasilense]
MPGPSPWASAAGAVHAMVMPGGHETWRQPPTADPPRWRIRPPSRRMRCCRPRATCCPYGSLVLGANGQYTYVLANAQANVQALAAGQTVTETFTYTVSDGQAHADAGENLIAQSEAFGGASWVAFNGNGALPTITSNAATGPTGTATADVLSLTADSGLYTATAVSGQYTFSIWIRLVSGNGNFAFNYYDGASDGIQTGTATGEWQRFSWTFTGNGNSDANVAILHDLASSTGSVFEIWGAQINSGGSAGTYVATTGTPVAATTVTTQNLIAQSEAFDDASWAHFTVTGTQPTVTANAATGPTGSGTADLLSLSGIGAGIYVNTAVSGQYTFSVWVRLASGDGHFSFNYYDGSSNHLQSATATGEWQRLSWTFDANGNGNANVAIMHDLATATSGVLELWGAQLNQGASADSYIATTGSPVTVTSAGTGGETTTLTIAITGAADSSTGGPALPVAVADTAAVSEDGVLHLWQPRARRQRTVHLCPGQCPGERAGAGGRAQRHRRLPLHRLGRGEPHRHHAEPAALLGGTRQSGLGALQLERRLRHGDGGRGAEPDRHQDGRAAEHDGLRHRPLHQHGGQRAVHLQRLDPPGRGRRAFQLQLL